MRFLALFAVLASTGCAMIAAKAPDPDRPRDQAPMCNDGKGGVVVDGLMATALGVATLGFASDGNGSGAAAAGIGTFIYGISAGIGSSSANKCREANEEYAALRERESVEAAFMRQGGGSTTAPGIPPEDEDRPRPVAVVKPPPPQPPPQQPQPPPPQPPSRPVSPPQPEHSGDDNDWSEFWKEVP